MSGGSLNPQPEGKGHPSRERNYWRAPERQLVEAGLWERRPGYNFQTNIHDETKVADDVARGLYEAYRGGLADWNRLTPENKRRWLRAAQYAINHIEHHE